MNSSLLLAAIPATAFGAFFLPLLLQRFGRGAASLAAAAVISSCLALVVQLAPTIFAGQTALARLHWLPAYGLDLSLRMDGLGLLFALLICGIGLLVVLYAFYYLPDSDRLGRFFSILLLFMAAMLGVVLSENILLLLVFWEITSLSSFLLVAYSHGKYEARIGARMALAVTGGGGLALLAGLLLLGHIAGSYDLSVILADGAQIRTHALYAPTLILILLGAFTKSAQFPFHFWLPNAMSAPTPVSAYLHSATMVKAGVFLLARLHPALGGTDLWFWLVSGTGAITLVYAAATALFRHDIKGLLAYSTISHLGLITLLFGLDTRLSIVAGVFHIINHAIFKASLFMAAGVIDHECGTRDMRRVNGMFKRMPITATLAIIAAGSMAGVPLLNGFLSKEMFFAETVGHPQFEALAWLLPLVATIAGILAVAYSLRFVHDVFFNGEPIDLPRQPHEPPRWMRAPIELLVLLCLLVGIFPQMTVAPLLRVAAAATLQAPLPAFELALWHGFNRPLMMSLLALAGGICIYALRAPLFAWQTQLPTMHPRTAFERAYRLLANAARAGVGLLDNGSLQRYNALLFAFVLMLGGWAFFSGPEGSIRLPVQPAGEAAYLALFALLLGSVGATLLYRQRLLAVILVGVVGLVVAMVFTRLSAPDLALTQLAVETGTIVLMLLVLYYLPTRASPASSASRLVRDLLLAMLAGGGLTLVTLRMLATPFETISGFYLRESVPGGGGTNVVNVILVDFRGFDTLGEITVLAIVALASHALLDRLTLIAPRTDSDGRPWSSEAHPLFLSMLMRPLLPLALTVSVYIFLRGHNVPGGGFVAGLITSVALVVQYLANGNAFAQQRLPRNAAGLLALGLLLATSVGIVSWLFGRPFLTSAHGHVSLPLIGEFELASVMIFDLGVYVVVVTVVITVLSGLGRLSERAHRGQAEV
ncbi:MAG TPA: monovalent cation/H+ antiporter subunit A [Accumulibacter sp.]|uniref:monovalent cation/H+ antiporter subunit A n=1 Tax=Accumulibacter sp. TaxID=2053492 RepID=UPI002C68245C|nr:monovalent cation/H+ antiporter subunit A [Accumulibacter sp.]HRF71896.1 monovalent cation/H+ antiporter subunit A [Accumulibacter sp.]